MYAGKYEKLDGPHDCEYSCDYGKLSDHGEDEGRVWCFKPGSYDYDSTCPTGHGETPVTLPTHGTGTSWHFGTGTMGPHGTDTMGPHEPGTMGPHEPGTMGPHGTDTMGPHGTGSMGPHGTGSMGPHGIGTMGPHG